MASLTLTVFVLATLLPYLNTEYIPPGPAYPCPKKTDNQLLFPCVCEKGTDAGLYVRCENTGLAVMSVGIGNIAGMGLPIERLLLKECKISHLFGPLLHRSTVRTLHIIDTPIKSIDEYAFAGVNRTLQEIYLYNTRINEFPKEAFKILGNLTILSIDGHRMTSLSKDIFGGSLATGRLEKLHLVNGLLTDIPPEAFQNLKKLKTLDLHGNRLATLKRNQFKGLRDTEVLDLSYNNITKLDGSHIGDLTKLGWCNASHNLLPDIPRGMFARNTVIKVVHLDNNKIKKLDTNSFRGMRFLRRLYLQDNEISDVGRGTFTAVTRIGTVDLARNKITKVDYQMFQAVKYAEIINLAENKITSIDKQAFTDLYLASVNISHNEISSIESGAFQNCNNMTLLDLSHNKLKEINKNAFDENTYAGEFQVSYNEFTDLGQIPIQNMTGIRVLNASHNSITTIPKTAFPKLYELHTVDVSHNNVSDIFNAVFQNLFSLRFLNLSHNSLERIKPSTFGTIHTILELDLSHNQLVDVSRGSLAKLASCRLLDISYNYLDRIFQIPISLGELNIAHNNLSEIKAGTWPVMNALLRLNLSTNVLEDRLTSDAFAGLLTLQSLDLSSNGLTKPPKLDLSYNSLDKIDNKTNGLLDDCLSLEMVNLSHNRFGFLSRKMFPANPWIPYRLMEVDLSYNEIPVVTFDITFGTKHLKKLNLSNNYINDIRNNVLGNLTSLEVLDVSNNQLKDLVSRTSDTKFNLPENITEIYLQNNTLEKLPTENLGKSNHLKVLDLRNNLLTSFYPELVKKIRDNNLMVYFENNKLKCDCFTRPLKHYLQKLPDSFLKNDDKYKSLACFEPPSLEDANFLELDEERLLCASNVELDDKIREYGNTEFDFTSEPDVLFRDIQYSQTSIYAFWYVPSTKDVADFYIYVRDSSNKLFFSQDVAYNLRSLSINVDKDFATNLQKGGKIEICIQAKSSSNFARKFFDSQCQIVPSNYDSWSDKLTAAKRKLSRKRVKYIHHSRSSVLGLVSDSILITLCIFLGVCFRRLADLDV
ncbi:jg4888 [Pararge aegeria aegeria]|uniref:Jg4888 protein n=1 Tax=Pararge aegeria aegeria TaxID=348720 RepID=A0A8S4RP09_9NEOP|nr:jg4888 [Pararge aegeria aegeria]